MTKPSSDKVYVKKTKAMMMTFHNSNLQTGVLDR